MTPVERQAVRAILLTENREVLLMRIRNPVTHLEFWICPGGGLSPGENLQDGLRRELMEELSLTTFETHHQVHKRHHTFNWKEERISQHETFYVVHTSKFDPVITDPVEREVVQEFRWWKVSELDQAKHPVTPRKLRNIIEDYLEHGPPRGPLEVDVQLD